MPTFCWKPKDPPDFRLLFRHMSPTGYNVVSIEGALYMDVAVAQQRCGLRKLQPLCRRACASIAWRRLDTEQCNLFAYITQKLYDRRRVSQSFVKVVNAEPTRAGDTCSSREQRLVAERSSISVDGCIRYRYFLTSPTKLNNGRQK